MSLDLETIYKLLPAVYRIRDAEQGEPLKGLLGVIAEQVAVIEEDLAQRYDDHFIETCADWVIPYIGDLIGHRTLHETPNIASPRAEVANTIAYRRRKGTAVMLEQLARDVTGWRACVVETFPAAGDHATPEPHPPRQSPGLSGRTQQEHSHGQYQRKLPSALGAIRAPRHRVRQSRPHCGRAEHRNRPGTLQHPQRGNFPLAAEQLFSYRHRSDPASVAGQSALFFQPARERHATVHAARKPGGIHKPGNPDECSRTDQPTEHSSEHLSEYYGPEKSLLLQVNGKPVTPDQIAVCNLSDLPDGNWAHQPPAGKLVGIDPVLGRIAFRDTQPNPPLVTFHYGFSADMGGGEYDRLATFDTEVENS